MDATTWSGQTSGSNGYGGYNQVDPMGVWTHAWNLQQTGLPGHSHLYCGFYVNYNDTGDTNGGQIDIRLNWDGYQFNDTYVAAGSQGTVYINSPPPKYMQQLYPGMTNTASGNNADNWQIETFSSPMLIEVMGGEVVEGTADGVQNQPDYGYRQGPAPAEATFELDFASNADTRVAFKLSGTAQPYLPDAGEENYWLDDYTVSGAAYIGNGVWVTDIPAGALIGTVGFDPIVPYWGGPDSQKSIIVAVVPDPQHPLNAIPAVPGGSNPKLPTSVTDQLVPLLISPHVQGEMTDAQIEQDVENLTDPDPQVVANAEDNLSLGISYAPSQYVHDVLWSYYNGTAPQQAGWPVGPWPGAPKLWAIIQQQWPNMQMTWDASNWELDYAYVPQGHYVYTNGDIEYGIDELSSIIAGQDELWDNSSPWSVMAAPPNLGVVHLSPYKEGADYVTIRAQEWYGAGYATQGNLYRYDAEFTVYTPPIQ